MNSFLDKYTIEIYAGIVHIRWVSQFGLIGRATTLTGRVYYIWYHASKSLYSCYCRHYNDRQEFNDIEQLKVYLAHH
jgi:hypothetical protein